MHRSLLVGRTPRDYGLLVSEGPGDLETCSDNAGKLFTLNPADSAERNPTAVCLADSLTLQEFRDLLVF
jgi:hypothetical protein